MTRPAIFVKKKLLLVLAVFQIVALLLFARIAYLQFFRAEELQTRAYEQQTRDRLITPNRGSIFDRNMVGIAKTESVASVSVIHSQLRDREMTARVLASVLDLDYEETLDRVSRRVALQRIQTKVDKETADRIRGFNLPGVMIDEDVRRIYPFSTLAAQVIGFVGRDNQGIIGLEARYDSFLKGESGKLLTETDVRGRRTPGSPEIRLSPVQGDHLVLTLDAVLQQYAEQTLQKALMTTSAKRGSIIVMDPRSGEILAMANMPDFDLNDPFTINDPELAAMWAHLTSEERHDALNRMWRNFTINDTYEPGSSFKVVTSAAGLEEGVVTPASMFNCGGSVAVGGHKIRCWRYPRAHGSGTFVEGVYNSCNPVFMETAARLGAETFYRYLELFGIMRKTGVDLPGEASGIMHKPENIGTVELATISFGQSFQITPIQLLAAASACINGGYKITPHIALRTIAEDGRITNEFSPPQGERILSLETSDILREILEGVVYTGTGNRTYIPGYRVGGKTATSEKLPRRSGKYISSFMAFAPAEDPQVIALVLIDEPVGAYYGGQVAGPVMRELLETALPLLNIEPVYDEKEAERPDVANAIVPELRGLTPEEAAIFLKEQDIEHELVGEGEMITRQLPMPGEVVNRDTKIIIYAD
ncbi:MAG: penicillin-binding transpeptidase domain-containing protein [Defluviitaleaceae bacterium]|nr:penicillin-binding transpeptidase domain-containing protein [Defluviitaleaceae bacterium]